MAALIPEEYGGSGLSLTAASVIMEEINRTGGNSGAGHGQMYNMGSLFRHGSEEQKRLYLRKIASGEIELMAPGFVTRGAELQYGLVLLSCQHDANIRAGFGPETP